MVTRFETFTGEVEEEGEEKGEGGEGSTLESSCCDSNEGDDRAGGETLGIAEVKKNQTSKPMVNPRRDNVSI